MFDTILYSTAAESGSYEDMKKRGNAHEETGIGLRSKLTARPFVVLEDLGL